MLGYLSEPKRYLYGGARYNVGATTNPYSLGGPMPNKDQPFQYLYSRKKNTANVKYPDEGAWIIRRTGGGMPMATATMPASWSPSSPINQWPWQQISNIGSDISRQRAYETGITPGVGGSRFSLMSGQFFNPLTGFNTGRNRTVPNEMQYNLSRYANLYRRLMGGL